MDTTSERLIIFDLDGVLFDTERAHREALLSAIETHTGMLREDLEALIRIDGRTTLQKVNHLGETLGWDQNVRDRIVSEKTRLSKQMLCSVPLRCEIKQLLNRLHQKATLALASNARSDTISDTIRGKEISHLFGTIISAEQTNHPKPDPEIFLTVMERLGFTPDQTIIVEDSDAGRQAAQASGARLWAVDSPYDPRLLELMNEFVES